jgi:hypothetical protein
VSGNDCYTASVIKESVRKLNAVKIVVLLHNEEVSTALHQYVYGTVFSETHRVVKAGKHLIIPFQDTDDIN